MTPAKENMGLYTPGSVWLPSVNVKFTLAVDEDDIWSDLKTAKAVCWE